MSKDETGLIVVLLDNAENMIAEGLDGLARAQKAALGLSKQLFDCEAKLADCKAEKINRAEESAECKAKLKELFEAMSHGTVAVFAGRYGYDVPSPFPGPEDLWLFYARTFKAVLESHPAELESKSVEKREPSYELLREFVEAVAIGQVAYFASKKGWIKRFGFKGKVDDYYREIADLVLEPRPKDFKAWQAKYYPVPAKEVPEEQRARAALQRWRGLTAEVLAEFGITKSGKVLTDGKNRHIVGGDTCALCIGGCRSCLLYKVRHDACLACPPSPYGTWVDTGDAGPMIAALEKAVELEIEKYGEESPAVAS